MRIAVAQYNLAQVDDGTDLSQFDHRLSFEADGKTDGPINALVHFALGSFTENQLRNYAKGGFFVNQEGMTLNEQSVVDSKDLYETAAELAETNVQGLKDRLVGLKNGKALVEKMSALQRILVNLGELEKDGENIIIGRKSLKNPLTISMYGSSASGMIEDQFGEDGFMVRKDMIDNAVGYRGLSLGEAWAGPSNMSHDTKKAIRDFATAVRGKNAYRDLTVATKAIQAGVSVAKNIIVVTSIVIPIANAASNVQQIMTHGVSPRDIWNGIKTKLVEVERLQKLEKRIAEIQALKAVNRNKDVELRKLLAEEKSINDSISRMSIGAMVKAGEFTTIAEGELNLDAALTQGSWSDQLTKVVDRIPAKLGVVGRYAAVSRDTAVFKGLARSVQYGDFLAKSILYDHLTKKKNQTHEQAMKVVIDEFVAYNILPSRERQAAEQIGAMWFWAYKLRSIKVAHRMIRNNPLRAMMAGFAGPLLPDVPGVNVGSPITDNAISAIADGRGGYSIGWGMLFRAPSLHPILGWMY